MIYEKPDIVIGFISPFECCCGTKFDKEVTLVFKNAQL
jgi:hypothetical protein